MWNACKPNADDSGQPNHEIDVLSGHENDVNYVQFRLVWLGILPTIINKLLHPDKSYSVLCSGCAVAPKFTSSDTSKEENVPKFRNFWCVSLFLCFFFRGWGWGVKSSMLCGLSFSLFLFFLQLHI